MGFLRLRLPRRFDVLMWQLGSRMERIRPFVVDWAENGPGTPLIAYPIYFAKVVCYALGGLWIIQATSGIGSLAQVGQWWTEPVVFQKALIWSLLFEVAGLGCGFGLLTARFLPPMGGLFYWLRPGTIRLPPWSGRVPLTRGSRRSVLDALFYLALLASAVWLLISPAMHTDLGLYGPVHMLDPVRLIPLAVLVPLVGLRDKTIFLAARAEHLWVALLVLFLPYLDMIIMLKLLVVLLWWGAATSKMNRLFPYAVSVMLTISPLLPRSGKRRLWRRFPADLRPSGLVKGLVRGGTLIELVVPLVLLVSSDRLVTAIAVVTMVGFHLQIMGSMPNGQPHEWNVFTIFSIGYLFWGHFDDHVGLMPHPWLLAALAVAWLGVVVWGNLRPDQVSFLLAMRYYTGNWATSLWAFQPSAISKINKRVSMASAFLKEQTRPLYGEHVAEVLVHKVLVFRSMHHHGRGVFGLLPHVTRPEREEGEKYDEYVVLDGEMVSGALMGWNFGDGLLHNEQMMAALHERCEFKPGEVRAVMLEPAPAGGDRQAYRLVDAATGELERGNVMVDDLLERQPWEVDDLPRTPLVSRPPRVRS